MIKARIKFTKSGSMKFLGHLDVMRFFQKAFRRSGIDIMYSQGYSPHQLISFAAPLGVGLTSNAEYVDVQLGSMPSSKEIIEQINSAMTEELQIVSIKVLPEDSKNAMSIVAAADYLVLLKDGYELLHNDKEVFENKFAEFMNLPQIIIQKKTKRSEKEVDIKPFIYHYSFTAEEFAKKIGHTDNQNVAQEYENGIKLYLQVATGSVNNLKPELVMEAFCNSTGVEFNQFAYQIHRLEVYASKSEENPMDLIPLDDIGEEKN